MTCSEIIPERTEIWESEWSVTEMGCSGLCSQNADCWL